MTAFYRDKNNSETSLKKMKHFLSVRISNALLEKNVKFYYRKIIKWERNWNLLEKNTIGRSII